MILVTGASGFVGGKLMRHFPDAIACPSLRGASEEDVRRIVEQSGADTIIHTAAIADIGVCVRDPDASYAANVLLPVSLAKAAGGCKLICFSSDQVYGGTEAEGPYTEDMAKPSHTYGAHKLEMENRVLDIAPDAVMLRAEWMYDFISPKGNYFLNVLKESGTLSFSSRQYRGLTYVREVAENMERVARLPGGVYNFGSETKKSIYEITKGFLSLLCKSTPLEDAPPSHNLWMNCEKARRLGVAFRSVEDALAECARDAGLLAARADR